MDADVPKYYIIMFYIVHIKIAVMKSGKHAVNLERLFRDKNH